MKNYLGIIGGGQLGRMLALAAIPLGFKVSVLEASADCPASDCANVVIGSFKDANAIKNFAASVDFLTIEIESANADALEAVVASGKAIFPQPHILRGIKDKWAQKQFYQQHNIPCAPSRAINSIAEVEQAAEEFGYPLLLKSRFDAYDGRGNAVVRSPADIPAAFARLGGERLYVEAFVPFVKELAVMVARDQHGNMATYPVVETIHHNNICHTVICPAAVDANITTAATELAQRIVREWQGVGMFGVELFLTADGALAVNEVAPRVHNSGHYTTEACITSQFEQHIRIVTGLPLGDTSLKMPAAVMMNILGQRSMPAQTDFLAQALQCDGVSVHWYGKAEERLERKMGHLTAVADHVETAFQRAQAALAAWNKVDKQTE